ncbi:hypothetical protein PG993_010459 [Apiospora rasikravindrae]|uniref:XPG-I domain-containing protein n=1 Tax=Apiospora rasikravindrae TaxID=990691 RepID=A0ABR1SP15_9PEZI
MGIKGTLPLAELNAEHVEKTGQPMRIAIDTPLAVYKYRTGTDHVYAEGRGGMNHPTRTLFFHITHILETGVQPVFVYDGSGRPNLKRGVHTTAGSYQPFEPRSERLGRTNADEKREQDVQHIIYLSKKILDLLGLPRIDAFGEAEAECARLEKAGLVDAVMSADGDAFLFGAQTVLHYLTEDKKDKAKGRRVRVLQTKDLENETTKLTQRVLFSLALFAGGDYNTGVENCGPELALAIGTSKHGAILWTQAKRHLWHQLPQWRDRLAQELKTGSVSFGKKHPAVAESLCKNYPDFQKVAEYYVRELTRDPATSAIDWKKEADKPGLWKFTGKYFDWKHRHFAVKFVRVTSVALLVRRILHCPSSGAVKPREPIATVSKTRGEGAKKEAMIKFGRCSIVDLDPNDEDIVESHMGNLKQVEVKDDPVWLPHWLVQKHPDLFQHPSETAGSSKRKSTGTATADVETPSKRPRGQPPSKPAASSPNTATGPKRGPGRPSKRKPTSTKDADPDTTTPKRGRGRPPKPKGPASTSPCGTTFQCPSVDRAPLAPISTDSNTATTRLQTPTSASAISTSKPPKPKVTESPRASSARNPHYSLADLREFMDDL